ncbi:acyl carrier protein [Rhodocytophaga rosea]|uniref:Acyl carrier protein n=1 Tax=Rhodocytophaga rosea TaxID=2704465 RepID=A0A6C0GUH6_9BACT|nr:acyl carrier protein [Rhodocytophaga rosea]QHT71454.1 acyl carrier protein [Rhodocytophaga rosea]
MESVQQKVTNILIEKLGIEISQITPSANFIKDLGIDSLDYVELIMEFEQSFNIRISDTDGEQIKTVGQAVSYIEHKLAESVVRVA